MILENMIFFHYSNHIHSQAYSNFCIQIFSSLPELVMYIITSMYQIVFSLILRIFVVFPPLVQQQQLPQPPQQQKCQQQPPQHGANVARWSRCWERVWTSQPWDCALPQRYRSTAGRSTLTSNTGWVRRNFPASLKISLIHIIIFRWNCVGKKRLSWPISLMNVNIF